LRSHEPADGETYGTQRIIKRSITYVVGPSVVIGFLAILTAWEVVRANVPAAATTLAPFNVSFLGAGASATLLGGAIGLFLARMQWARSLRPSIGFATDDKDEQFSEKSSVWRFWIHNGGSGVATIEKFSYRIRFSGAPDPSKGGFVDLRTAVNTMTGRGLAPGTDFFIRQQAKGMPLTPTPRYHQGNLFAWLTVSTLAQLERFDVKVWAMDAAGDIHERIFPCMDRLPHAAQLAIGHLASEESGESGTPNIRDLRDLP
jgi:hypothetical protein